jgi:hypothetical protein
MPSKSKMARSKTTPACPDDVLAYPQPRSHPPSPPSPKNSDVSTPSPVKSSEQIEPFSLSPPKSTTTSAPFKTFKRTYKPRKTKSVEISTRKSARISRKIKPGNQEPAFVNLDDVDLDNPSPQPKEKTISLSEKVSSASKKKIKGKELLKDYLVKSKKNTSVPLFSPHLDSIFAESWALRPVAVGKIYDFEDLLSGGFDILKPVNHQGWTNFLRMKDVYFPKLVRAFYFKAKGYPDKSMIVSNIKGVEIRLEPDTLADIIGIPKGGIQVCGPNWYSKLVTCKTDLIRKMFFVGDERITEIPTSSQLKPEFKILHSLCLFNLLPHTGNKNKVSDNDLLIMH